MINNEDVLLYQQLNIKYMKLINEIGRRTLQIAEANIPFTSVINPQAIKSEKSLQKRETVLKADPPSLYDIDKMIKTRDRLQDQLKLIEQLRRSLHTNDM